MKCCLVTMNHGNQINIRNKNSTFASISGVYLHVLVQKILFSIENSLKMHLKYLKTILDAQVT